MKLDIRVKRSTPAELETRTAIGWLLKKYRLNEYLFTRDVEIDEESRPHSHPVLTLDTRLRENKTLLLSTFVHEQLHWFEEEHAAERDLAIEETKRYYRNVPCSPPEGAANEASTRLHLLVCYLEYRVMQRLVGESVGRQVMRDLARDHYSWIYHTVLEDEGRIDQIVRKYNLIPKGLQ
jgi:hypothetical protein